jgi:hypothetical protein
MINFVLDSEVLAPPDEAASGEEKKLDSPFASNLIGAWELTASTRRKGKQLFLSLNLTENGILLDENRKIATWSVDQKNKITFDFVDGRFEEAVLGNKNADKLFGKARSGRDAWTLTLDRIRAVAVCNTDRLGKITLHSNGRIDGANGLKSKSYWNVQGRKLQIGNYSCTLSANRTTFTGRGPYGSKIKGTFAIIRKEGNVKSGK